MLPQLIATDAAPIATATVAPDGTVSDEPSAPPPSYVPADDADHHDMYVHVHDGMLVKFCAFVVTAVPAEAEPPVTD